MIETEGQKRLEQITAAPDCPADDRRPDAWPGFNGGGSIAAGTR